MRKLTHTHNLTPTLFNYHSWQLYNIKYIHEDNTEYNDNNDYDSNEDDKDDVNNEINIYIFISCSAYR